MEREREMSTKIRLQAKICLDLTENESKLTNSMIITQRTLTVDFTGVTMVCDDGKFQSQKESPQDNSQGNIL